MPPKKKVTVAVETPEVAEPSSSEAVVDENDAAALRKIATHPPTAIMVREALKELDSRKGVSSKAIQNYIKQKYPSVDSVRLRNLVRRALKKGIENGTLVRPANSNVTTGAIGKFRLPPNAKAAKAKGENADPNAQKAPKAAKNADKKSPKAGATKASAKSQEEPKPPKKLKKAEEAATTKAAPAKKPKAKKAAGKEDDKGASDAPKKEAKATKEPKASKSKAAKADAADAPATKATGKRGKKTAEKTAE
ncbi:protein B4 [Solea solea]|uniref:protein B4 n=1 Tax=Solea solea TaxID=90069 RepID=UPI00272970C6|nr:protein B4 [Solea solea]